MASVTKNLILGKSGILQSIVRSQSVLSRGFFGFQLKSSKGVPEFMSHFCRTLSTLKPNHFFTESPMAQRNDWSFESIARRNYSFLKSTPTLSSILTSKYLLNHPSLSSQSPLNQIQTRSFHDEMMYLHLCGPIIKKRPKRQPLDGRPQMKGVVLKTLVKKPKKPNSANRKCVQVRLSNGKEAIAYVPGIGHALQEHNIVLVRCGRLQDVPGVKLKCVRGAYDLPHVIKQQPLK